MNYYMCVYFTGSTYLLKGSEVLKNAAVPHRLMRLSENIGVTGCNRCILFSSEYKERALSALNKAGCRYLSYKEVGRL